jgi:hypothetical protein
MDLPTPALPIGRWIYSTDKSNSTGHWFFVGDKVKPTETSPTTTSTINKPINHMTTQTDINYIDQISTEDLVAELKKRSPEEVNRLISTSIQTSSLPSSLPDDVTIQSEPSSEIDYDLESITKDVEQIIKENDSRLNSATPTLNLKRMSEPQIYQPTIMIDTPQENPESRHKKKKTNHTPRYDPMNPGIKKKYTILTTDNKEKSFICNVCRRSFGNKGSFTRHYTSTHGESNYECMECGIQTTRKDSLKNHYELKHPEVNYKESTPYNKPPSTIRTVVKPKKTLNDLNLKGNISPSLLKKLQETINVHQGN